MSSINLTKNGGGMLKKIFILMTVAVILSFSYDVCVPDILMADSLDKNGYRSNGGKVRSYKVQLTGRVFGYTSLIDGEEFYFYFHDNGTFETSKDYFFYEDDVQNGFYVQLLNNYFLIINYYYPVSGVGNLLFYPCYYMIGVFNNDQQNIEFIVSKQSNYLILLNLLLYQTLYIDLVEIFWGTGTITAENDL